LSKKIQESKLKNVIAKVFGIEAETINDSSSQDTVENWDSIRHMNLILALEEELGVELTDEQTVEILSYPLIKIVLREHGFELT
jgi:acyl carrier protein